MIDGSLDEADFTDAVAVGFEATQLTAIGAVFVRANLQKARLHHISLSLSDFTNADLSGGFLVGAQLHRVKFDGCDLTDADLSDTELYGAKLAGAKLSGAKFERAKYDTKTTWPGAPPEGAVFVEKPDL